MIPVEVTGISISPPVRGYVVILKEKDGDQWLPIFIGEAEAHTISLLMQGLKYIRPLTYDLFNNLLEASSAKIEKVGKISQKRNLSALQWSQYDGGIFLKKAISFNHEQAWNQTSLTVLCMGHSCA